jgi:hypothetical protein
MATDLPMRAPHHVGGVQPLDDLRHAVDRVGAVGIGDADRVILSGEDAGFQRGAVAAVAAVKQDGRPGLLGLPRRVVGGAVVDHQDFVNQVGLLQRLRYPPHHGGHTISSLSAGITTLTWVMPVKGSRRLFPWKIAKGRCPPSTPLSLTFGSTFIVVAPKQ